MLIPKTILLPLLCFFGFVHIRAQDTWEVLATGTTVALRDVQCLSTDTVFVFGNDGTVLRSFDNGTTLQEFQVPTSGDFSAGHFLDTLNGFAGNGSGQLLRTSDGGNSWIPESSCTCYIVDIAFSNAQDGVYSGLSGVRNTTDAGVTWSSSPVAVPSALSHIKGLSDSILIGVKNRAIYKSVDGGASFTGDTLLASLDYFTSLDFYSDTEGVAVSYEGNLYRSTDQGASWWLHTSTGMTVSRIAFLDSLRGYLLVTPGNTALYATLDGGITWSFSYSSPEVIARLDHAGSTLFAVGQNGLMLRNHAPLATPAPHASLSLVTWPNPASEMLHYPSSLTLQKATADVLDAQGQVVWSGILPPQGLPVGELPSGIYLLRVQGVGSARFVRL